MPLYKYCTCSVRGNVGTKKTAAQCTFNGLNYCGYLIIEASALYVQEIACLMTSFGKMPSFQEASSRLRET